MEKNKDDVDNNDEIEEGEELEDEGELTIPWPSPETNVNSENSDIGNKEIEPDQMDVSDEEINSDEMDEDDLDSDETDGSTEMICTSDINKYNSHLLKENAKFEELTIDEDTIIDGATWITNLLCIEKGCSVSIINNGNLYVILDNGQQIKVVGENHNSLKAVEEDFIMGKSEFFDI